MSGKVVQLRTPLSDEVLKLKAGDHVELSGTVYTARDEAHLRMQERGVPFDPKGAVIYHCGPVIQDGRVIAAGPTTSARMNELEGFLIEKGVRALIGKGGMGITVKDQLRGRGVYLAFTGGCAALASSHMKLKGVYYEDLGMAEAVWAIELDRLPLVVGIDACGNDIFDTAREHAEAAFREYSPCSAGAGTDPKKRFFEPAAEYILRQDCRSMKLAIDEIRCKGCNLCTKVCPYKIFREGKKLNRKGIAVPELDRPERCANCRLRNLYGRQLCGVCQLICPDQAIHWIDEEPYEPHKVAIEY